MVAETEFPVFPVEESAMERALKSPEQARPSLTCVKPFSGQTMFPCGAPPPALPEPEEMNALSLLTSPEVVGA